jgi:anti-sigma factor RsiW
MPTCREFLQMLGDYLDGGIDPGSRAAIDRHLALCPRCRIVCATTRKTLQLYKLLPPRGVSVEIESRLMASLERRFGGKG